MEPSESLVKCGWFSSQEPVLAHVTSLVVTVPLRKVDDEVTGVSELGYFELLMCLFKDGAGVSCSCSETCSVITFDCLFEFVDL